MESLRHTLKRREYDINVEGAKPSTQKVSIDAKALQALFSMSDTNGNGKVNGKGKFQSGKFNKGKGKQGGKGNHNQQGGKQGNNGKQGGKPERQGKKGDIVLELWFGWTLLKGL